MSDNRYRTEAVSPAHVETTRRLYTKNTNLLRFLVNVLWTLGGKAGYVVGHLLVVAVLARLLSPAEFGVAAVAQAVAQLSMLLSFGGLAPVLVRLDALTATTARRALLALFAVNLGLTFLYVLILTPVVTRVLPFDGMSTALFSLSPSFVVGGVGTYYRALLQRSLSYRRISAVDLLSGIIGYCFPAMAMAWLNFGALALTVPAVVAATMSTAGYAVAGRKHRFDSGECHVSTRTLLHGAFGFGLTDLLNAVAMQVDKLIVARRLGPFHAGQYGRAVALAVVPAQLLIQTFDYVAFGTAARTHGDVDGLRSAFVGGTAFVMWSVAPVCVCLSIFGPVLVTAILGGNWDSAVPAFQIMAMFVPCRVLYKIPDLICRIRGAVFVRAALFAWFVVMVAVLCAIAAPVGIEAAALAVGVCYLVNWIQLSIVAIRLLGGLGSTAYRSLLCIAVYALVCCGAFWITSAGLCFLLTRPVLRVLVLSAAFTVIHQSMSGLLLRQISNPAAMNAVRLASLATAVLRRQNKSCPVETPVYE